MPNPSPRPDAEVRPLATAGRVLYAIPIIALGAMHVGYADFVTRLTPSWPAWAPPRPVSACLVGVALMGAGLAILLKWRTRAAAFVVAAIIALSLVFLHVPRVVANPGSGGTWTSPVKFLTIGGGALLVAALFSAPGTRSKNGILLALGRIFFSIFLVLCGVQHFVYSDFVATLVPAWIPGHFFWTYFAGVALIAGGIGMTIPRTARWAGLLSALMILLWVPLVHIPRALASGTQEWSGVWEALAMSGIALLVAASLPQTPGAQSRSSRSNA